MAIRGVIDYSKAPLQDTAITNLSENLLKGYKMGQEPAKMRDEAELRKMTNQLKKLDLEHKPKEYELNDKQKTLANALQAKALEHYEEKFQLEKDYKQAQIKKALQQKVGGSPKANGELANYMVTHPDASPDELRKAYEEIHGSKLEHEKAVTERSRDITTGNSFDKLPTNDKKQAVALMKGMDVDPVASVAWLRSGKTPTDYAQEHGIDINKVEPDYSAGEQNIKMAQQANAYMEEIDTLDKHINEGLGKYQNKIMGYSLEQIADAAEGKNSDQQARALAARALLPELNSLRLKIAGGNIGIEALRELEQKSLGKLNVLESLVDSETYTKAQNYMTQWIKEAGQVRVKSLINNSKLKSHLQKGAAAEAKKAKILNLATGKWEEE